MSLSFNLTHTIATLLTSLPLSYPHQHYSSLFHFPYTFFSPIPTFAYDPTLPNLLFLSLAHTNSTLPYSPSVSLAALLIYPSYLPALHPYLTTTYLVLKVCGSWSWRGARNRRRPDRGSQRGLPACDEQFHEAVHAGCSRSGYGLDLVPVLRRR